MADDEPKTTAMSVASLPRPHRTRRSTAVLALLLSAACATAGADYEDNTADGTAGWWSRLFGADEAQVQGYADQLDSALDGAAAAELQRRGYGELRSDLNGAKEALLRGDTDSLRGYADRVDGALAGELSGKLDESGYGSQVRSWWERIKGWLFDE